ncbi:MAG: hypothetical protein L0Y73_08435, partial [Candidatus Aminicenantes bacterium]|nr:hypothetical protein [Candidatus Aminicenantes bacterium]
KLDSQKQELENTKKEKNDSFNAEHKEVADKKKEVDAVLDKEKKQFKEAQRDVSNADNRIKQINKEEEQLTAKAAAPDTPQEEKNAIPQKLEALRSEKSDLQNKWNTVSAAVKTTEEKIKPLEEESSKYQAEIDKIKDEQRKTIGELDDSLSKINKETSDQKTNLSNITIEQNKNFGHLGEKIAGAGISNPSIAAELDAANITKKEIETIEVSIQSLEHQGTAASRGAFWKMIGVIAAGVVVVVGLIIVISMLLGGKKEPENPLVSILSRGDKNITPAQVEAMKQIGEKMLEQKAKEESESESSEENAETDEEETKTPATPEEAMKEMTDAAGELRKQSEQLAGKKLVASNKEALMAVLPDVGGWKQENTNYNKGSFGQLEYSDLNTTYKNAAGQEVQVRISDTAAASAMLQMYRMAFNMNISH